MRGILTLALCLGLCAIPASGSHAMDLRDMPKWLRDMIETVEIDWAQLAPAGMGVHIGLTGTAPGGVPGEVHIGGTGGVANVGEVHLGGPGAATGPGGVHIVDTATFARAGVCVTTIQEQNMTPADFVAWAQENEMTPEVLTRAISIAKLEWPRMNQTCTVLCAGLLAAAGEDLAALDTIPVEGRFPLAVYLGELNRGGDVLAVLDSVTDAEMRALPQQLLDVTRAHLIYDVPRESVQVIKRQAEVAGRRRHVCLALMIACRRLEETQIVEQDLIPLAERALEEMPPTDEWYYALGALIWAYQFLEDHEKAVEVGQHWLQALEGMGVDTKGSNARWVNSMLQESQQRMKQR